MKIRTIFATILFVAGLYGIMFGVNPTYRSLGFVALIWGGWWVGEAIRGRKNP